MLKLQNWNELKYWDTGEYQVIQERLKGTKYCPGYLNLFAALRATPYNKVKVVFIGQDPYPDPKYATGLSFSIPKEELKWPPTLVNLIKEYINDLGFITPDNGDLTKWTKEGVLLWNAIPSCDIGKSLSHNWSEWYLLTEEILKSLEGKGIVFVFFGSFAKEFSKVLNPFEHIIFVSHPSPRGSLHSKTPFFGSKIFTRANSLLKEPIDWRL